MIGSAQADVLHYACKGEGSRYSLTMNMDRNSIKMQDHGPSAKIITFRMLSGSPDNTPDACARGGWTLSDGATFCYYTQGAASLSWHGHDYECDQADWSLETKEKGHEKLAFVLCLLSTTAHAYDREWVGFIIIDDDEIMFVDPATEKTVGNVRSLSILTNLDFNNGSSSISDYQFNCKTEKFRMMAHAEFPLPNAKGKAFDISPKPDPWDDIDRAKYGYEVQAIFEKVCSISYED
jgi:hypothetical protein